MWGRSTSEDGKLLNLGNPADAAPAVFSHLSKVFHAVKVNWNIGSLFVGSFLADGEGFVDVIDADDFLVVGAVVVWEFEGAGDGDEYEENNDLFHVDF